MVERVVNALDQGSVWILVGVILLALLGLITSIVVARRHGITEMSFGLKMIGLSVHWKVTEDESAE